ncbi:hypothetical protein C8J56DRAFT_481671 [Mycena floridula]|nr:hypothetical protein C8J56DRAFT_481671 [Mycena floridula]
MSPVDSSRSPDLMPVPSYKIILGVQLVSLTGLSIILLTAICARRVKRHAIWCNFIGAWLWSSFIWILLPITGQLDTNFQVPHKLCLAQGILIHIYPVFTSAASMSFVLYTWLMCRSILSNQPLKLRPRTSIMLLALPYVLAIANLIAILLYGLHHPTAVVRVNHLQCIVATPFLQTVVLGIALAGSTSTVLLQASIGYFLYQSHSLFVGSREYGRIIRILAFSVLDGFAIGVEIYLLIDRFEHPASIQLQNMVAVILPCVGMIVFGSQKDMLRVWMFWLSPKEDKRPRENPELRSSQASFPLDIIIITHLRETSTETPLGGRISQIEDESPIKISDHFSARDLGDVDSPVELYGDFRRSDFSEVESPCEPNRRLLL